MVIESEGIEVVQIYRWIFANSQATTETMNHHNRCVFRYWFDGLVANRITPKLNFFMEIIPASKEASLTLLLYISA